jgi:hypothetical protein
MLRVSECMQMCVRKYMYIYIVYTWTFVHFLGVAVFPHTDKMCLYACVRVCVCLFVCMHIMSVTQTLCVCVCVCVCSGLLCYLRLISIVFVCVCVLRLYIMRVCVCMWVYVCVCVHGRMSYMQYVYHKHVRACIHATYAGGMAMH